MLFTKINLFAIFLFAIADVYGTKFTAQQESENVTAKVSSRLLQNFFGPSAQDQEIVKQFEQQLALSLGKECIDIKGSKIKADQLSLNFCFDYSWRLKAVAVIGCGAFNSELEQLYQMYAVEQFNLPQHQDLLLKIKNKLFDYGYLKAQINDFLDLNFEHKNVKVKLDIDLGPTFYIKKISLVYAGTLSAGIRSLEQKIEKLCYSVLLKKRYEASLVDLCSSKVQDLLLGNDLLQVKIESNFDLESETLTLTLSQEDGILAVYNNANRFLGKDSKLKLANCLEKAVQKDLFKNGFLASTLSFNQDASIVAKPFKPVKIFNVELSLLEPAAMDLHAFNLETPTLKGQILNQQILQQQLLILRKVLLKQGFWQAQIDYELKYLDAEHVILKFMVNPGKNHFLRDVQVVVPADGQYRRIANILKANTKFKPFLTASPFLLEKQQQRLLALLQEEGFFAAQINIDVQSEEVEDDVELDIKYVVDPGKKPKFGAIELSNKTSVPSKHIRKKLQFATGQEWSVRRLQSSLSSIENMHLFKDVNFCTMPTITPSGNVLMPISLSTTQDKPREFCAKFGASIFGVGIKNKPENLNFSYNVGCQYTLKNPFLLADCLQTVLSVSRVQQLAEINYTCPEPFELPVDSKLSVFIGRAAVQDGLSWTPLDSSDFVSRTGICLTLSAESQHLGGLRFCAGLEGVCPPSLNRKHPENWTGYWFVGPSYCLNKVYSSWANRIGNSLNGVFQLVLPVSKAGGFVRTVFKDTIFIPVGGVAGLALEFGIEQNQGLQSAVYPELLNQRKDSLQKYAIFFPALSDHYQYVEQEQLVWDVLCQGKTKIFSFMAELRIRLWGSLAAVGYQGVRYIEEIGFLPSTGIGLRYTTPFGMLCLDVAAKWSNQQKLRDSCSWRLSLGQAF